MTVDILTPLLHKIIIHKNASVWTFINFDVWRTFRWLTIITFFLNFIFWPKFYFLTKILFFGQNFIVWQNFYFLTKILFSDKNFIFWPNFYFFSPKFYFLTKISFFDQNFNFLEFRPSIFQKKTKILTSFYQNFNFRKKIESV